MADGATPLAADFPPADLAAWWAAADAALGEGFVSRTPGGLAIQPLYTAADAVIPAPGRGEAGWDVRTLVDHPDPAEANVQALENLQNGAASILLALDPTGRRGVAAGGEADLARALEGVLLEAAPVALDAGWLGPAAADWLARLAKAAPSAPLFFHLDPLSAFAEAGISPGPMESWLFAAALAARRHAETYPRAGLFLASGRVVHEAGGSETQELGFALGAAIAYARAAATAALPAREALSRTVIGLSADADEFLTIAKLRAARMLFARLCVASGTGAEPRIEARSSRRMLARRDAELNLARLTAAGFAAAVGGADAILLDPYTQPLGPPTPEARRLARDTPTILLEESDLARVADPAGGSWCVESLTDAIAREAWAVFQAIEAAGGAVEALRTGLVADAVAGTRAAREAAIAEGRAAIVGVTAFAAPDVAEPHVAAIDPARFARPSPPARLPGPDSHCPPLAPWRAAAAYEVS